MSKPKLVAAPFRILTTTSPSDQNATPDRLSGNRPFRVLVDLDAAQRSNGLPDLQPVLLRPECRRPADDLRLFCPHSIRGFQSRILTTEGRCIGKMRNPHPLLKRHDIAQYSVRGFHAPEKHRPTHSQIKRRGNRAQTIKEKMPGAAARSSGAQRSVPGHTLVCPHGYKKGQGASFGGFGR